MLWLLATFDQMDTLRALNRIIERESKTSTYKFALLRGTIDIILEDSPFIRLTEQSAELPFGALVLKWILYYYPLLERFGGESQITGTTTRLSFQSALAALITHYQTRGGLSVFYNELKSQGIHEQARPIFLSVVKSVGECIRKNPMVYLGSSITGAHNSIYTYIPGARLETRQPFTIIWLMAGMGSFTIPRNYYDTLREFGSFIGGMDSILFKWGEFSYQASGRNHNLSDIITGVLQRPVDERDVSDAKRVYSNLQRNGQLYCVWSGQKLEKFDIDHVIPYSVLKNNDLWNLLPTTSAINNRKRDRVPAPDKVREAATHILNCWGELRSWLPTRFDNELQTALLGTPPGSQWQQDSLDRLSALCTYLIEIRGYDLWK